MLASADAEATPVLARLLQAGPLSAAEHFAVLRGLCQTELSPDVRMKRFDLLLQHGLGPHLQFGGPIWGIRNDAMPMVGEMRRHGWQPNLEQACRLGWTEDVRKLALQADELEPWTCLRAALIGDHPAVVHVIRESWGPSAWNAERIADHAVSLGAQRVLRDLLSRGLVTLEDGCSWMRSAALWGHAGVVEDLLDYGLPITADSDGFTPLHSARMSDAPDRLAIVECLLDHGANPNAWSDNGKSPLVETVRDRVDADAMNTVGALLEAGADPREGEFLDWLELWAQQSEPELRDEAGDLVRECHAAADRLDSRTR